MTRLFWPVSFDPDILTLKFYPFFRHVFLDPSIGTVLFGPIYLCPYICQEGLPCCQEGLPCCQEGLPCARKFYHGVRKHIPPLEKFQPPKSTKQLKSKNLICHLAFLQILDDSTKKKHILCVTYGRFHVKGPRKKVNVKKWIFFMKCER